MRSSNFKLQCGFGSAALFALFATMAWSPFALADNGRVVVLGPNQGQQPVGQNQHVTLAKTVLINGQPITVIRVEPMPQKAKFTICLKIPTGLPPPNDLTCVYFPFPQDHDEGGVHVSFEYQVNNTPGGDTYTVYRRACLGAAVCEGSKMKFPPGSILIPDPPQPAGLNFMADRYPADPATESAVLAALGLPDNLGPDVWFLTTNDLYFFTNGNPPGPPVHVSSSLQFGDLNCDGVVDAQDVSQLALALTNQAAYESANPSCDYFYADMNGDGVVNALDIAPFIAVVTGA